MPIPPRRAIALVAALALALAALTLAACGDNGESPAASTAPAAPATQPAASGSLTLYSGRGEELVGPLYEQFEKDTGIDLRIRYGGTSELAAAILEEGDRTPADIFFAQDAGALGALEDAGAFAPLPDDLLARVDPRFRSATAAWVGISGRARVVVYSTQRVDAASLPASIFDLTDPKYRGRVGWAPTNGSFQSFVTAMLQLDGDQKTLQWLREMIANGVREYSGNSGIVQAVADGEIDFGLVNHYYLWRFRAENPAFPAENLYTDPGGAGALINVAGAGILKASDKPDLARRFLDYMLSPAAQTYFVAEQEDDGFEYPLITGVTPNIALPPLADLQPPDLPLASLADLQGTLDLLRQAGALP